MMTDANAQELVPLTFDDAVGDLDEIMPTEEAATPASQGLADDLGAVFDVPVKVKAVLGGARVPVGELISMRSGSVLELDRRVGEPVDVYVNGRLIARGELVLIDGLLGVTLTEIVKQDG